jgi:hypothetical protein
MGRRWTGFVAAMMALPLSPSLAVAHSGGTDQYGCHVDHSTGQRHCHNEPGEETKYIPAAQVGIAIGSTLYVQGRERLDGYGAIHLQHEGSVFVTGGVALFYAPTPTSVGLYFDLGAGVGVFEGADTALTLRVSGGLKVHLFSFTERSTAHLLVGGFIELIADGANAEPAGVHVTLGTSL